MRIGDTYSAGQRKTEVRDPRSQMDINDFIQIMVAEIQNIDPLGGGDGGSKTDYISQMAQFSNLEQLTEISKGLEMLTLMGQQQYSFTMIGKEVTVYTGEYDSKGKLETVTGIVDRVKFKQGYITVQVDGKDYYMGDILEVGQEGSRVEKPENGQEPDDGQDPEAGKETED